MTDSPRRLSVPAHAFNDCYLDCLTAPQRHQLYFGGAGSGKSAFVAARCMLDALCGRSTLVVRQVARTLRFSCYNEISKAITRFGATMQITRVAGVPAVPGQVHELWLIAPGAAPVSLGLLQDRPLLITHETPPAGFTFAVSIEPEGGSPTGQPTGPVILTATLGAA